MIIIQNGLPALIVLFIGLNCISGIFQALIHLWLIIAFDAALPGSVGQALFHLVGLPFGNEFTGYFYY